MVLVTSDKEITHIKRLVHKEFIRFFWLWDLLGEQPPQILTHPMVAISVAWSPNGNPLAALLEGRIIIAQMIMPILATKLYVPPPRPKVVPRSRLLEQLNAGLHHKLTLTSAPAGFGKTTLASEWVTGFINADPLIRAESKVRVAWLSLDEGDNDPTRFLTYLVAALQTAAAHIGEGVLGALQSPQPPPVESILTALLNDTTTVPDHIVLVVDDYHVIDSQPVDHSLTFLLEHMPPRMHLVIATREDPNLPRARLRAQGH